MARRPRKVKLCPSHQERQTPLIWTTVFPEYEYWCPYCGYHANTNDNYETVEFTDNLREIYNEDHEKSKLYRKAAAAYFFDEIIVGRKLVRHDDLTSEMVDFYAKIRDEWVYPYEQSVLK